MSAASRRVIAHVDLDAFYASVEVRDRPELAGKPVVVGGEGRRSVVAAASYEARRFGIHSAMPMARARRACRELIIVTPRMGHYAAVSSSFFSILRRWSPLVEGLSLDEAFLDLSGTEALFGDPGDAVQRLRAEVRDELGLACSAGIAPVKFVAKIASDVAKPNGQLRVPDDGVLAFIGPLPIGRLWGVGEKRESELHHLGLVTIGDIGRCDPHTLARHIGQHAADHLIALAQGRDPRHVETDRDAKSIGAEETFEIDLTDPGDIAVHLQAQSERIASRLRHSHVVARGVTLKYKHNDFTLVTRQTTLKVPTDDGPTIFRAVQALLAAHPPQKPIRLCGVSAHRLEPAQGSLGLTGDARAAGLFDTPPPGNERVSRLNAAMDIIHQKHGSAAITRASLLGRAAPQNVPEPTRAGPATLPGLGGPSPKGRS